MKEEMKGEAGVSEGHNAKICNETVCACVWLCWVITERFTCR